MMLSARHRGNRDRSRPRLRGPRRNSLPLIALTALLLAACGGGDDRVDFPRVVELGEDGIYAEVVNSSLTLGENRFMLRLSDPDDERIFGATVALSFYDLNGDEPALRAEVEARFIGVETGYVDEQSGGTREVTGEDGVYVTSVAFDRAGDWGVRISVTDTAGEHDEFPFRFSVRERSDEPMVGDAAPPSVQATTASEPIEEIDSSSPPRAAMHGTTVRDALMSRKPAVVAFATPAFCRSRLCAPVLDTVMDPLFARYAAEASFIHVEPYLLRDLRDGFVENPVPATLEWGIASEPWIFVIDRHGRVAAKFEGIMALDEVEAALMAALTD
jgi:hypothetical protein